MKNDINENKALSQTSVMQSVIKGQELRIGNLIYFNGNHNEIGVVSEIFKNDLTKVSPYKIGINHRVDIYYNIDKLKPIPATESRLKELGFEKVYDGNYKRYQINLLETNIYLRPSLDKWYFGFVNNGQDCEINDCYELEFIHEIQNLIFSLTRVSLTVA